MYYLAVSMMMWASLAQLPSETEAKPVARLKFLRDNAARIVIDTEEASGGGRAKIQLLEQPILRWDNQRGTVVDGATFIWVQDHRPQAIGASWMTRKASLLEIQSLAPQPLRATFDSNRFWNPAQPGLTWKPVPDAPPPADSRPERLRQMKSLAQRFTTHAVKSPPDYPESSVWRFRMLTTPIYRYPEQAAVDGTIFAYTQGTDPEVFLLLESRTEKGSTQWYYGFAGACVWELHGLLDEVEVWIRPLASQRTPDGGYAVIENLPIDTELIPEKADRLK